MILAYLLTFGVAIASAFVPAIPIEAQLLAAVTTTESHPVALGVAAGVGQTAGKLVIFLGTRGALRSSWFVRWRERRERAAEEAEPRPPGRLRTASRRTAAGLRRAVPAVVARWAAVRARFKALAVRMIAALDRPALAGPVVFASALLGLPPLFAISVYAARTQITAPGFGALCLVGRSLRFIAVTTIPHLLLG